MSGIEFPKGKDVHHAAEPPKPPAGKAVPFPPRKKYTASSETVAANRNVSRSTANKLAQVTNKTKAVMARAQGKQQTCRGGFMIQVLENPENYRICQLNQDWENSDLKGNTIDHQLICRLHQNNKHFGILDLQSNKIHVRRNPKTNTKNNANNTQKQLPQKIIVDGEEIDVVHIDDDEWDEIFEWFAVEVDQVEKEEKSESKTKENTRGPNAGSNSESRIQEADRKNSQSEKDTTIKSRNDDERPATVGIRNQEKRIEDERKQLHQKEKLEKTVRKEKIDIEKQNNRVEKAKVDRNK